MGQPGTTSAGPAAAGTVIGVIDKHTRALVLALAARAPEATLAPVVAAHGHRMGESGASLITTLINRRPQPLGVLVALAGRLGAGEELALAQVEGLPTEVVEVLSRSKRLRTARALVKRGDLSQSAALRLGAHRDEEVARRARRARRFPTSERIRLAAASPVSELGAWAEADPEFSAWLLEGWALACLLSGAAGGRRPGLAGVLAGLPRHAEGERLAALLAPVFAAATGEELGAFVSQRRPRGLVLAAVLDAAGGTPAGEAYGAVDREAASLGIGFEVASPGRRARPTGVRPAWGDATSVVAAYRFGGRCRRAALGGGALPAELRAGSLAAALAGVAAGEAGAAEDLRALAHNPELAEAEVVAVLDALDPAERWRLFGARLGPDQRLALVSCGEAVPKMLLARWEPLPRPGQDPWADPAVLMAAAGERDRCLPGTLFSAWCAKAVKMHPELAGPLAALVRPRDELCGPVAVALAAAWEAAVPSAEAAETWLGLAPGWAGTVVGSAEAAGLMSGAAPGPRPA